MATHSSLLAWEITAVHGVAKSWTRRAHAIVCAPSTSIDNPCKERFFKHMENWPSCCIFIKYLPGLLRVLIQSMSHEQ